MCGTECLRFVSAGDVIIEEFPWGPHEWFVRPPLTRSEHLMLVRVTFPPGTAHQFHRHPCFEESIYCLDGEMEQWVEQEKKIMRPGDVAHIPMDTIHGSYNVSDEPAQFLVALASPRFHEPMVVDVFREEPWLSLKTPIEY